MSQDEKVKQAIFTCIRNGMNNKQDIYTSVVESLKVPRSTVRRVAGTFKNELLEIVRILNTSK